ncbi:MULTISPECIES: rod shape-determining protein MreC [unclassified Parvimonas]|uniref:rod shape-determining protein MreC n=1 Tax=unclassified Parvimonas TaxID=1151464 RepID=UPI002B489DFD|nr:MULTISPECIES: rod shape-determining protein MreC [unclassified Parvimonas]MEB3024731.1 rod shape-determining protein MreC [Parvimonas sp. M13]MEB3072256.1 rod shape-determining protein MreC [Parvimonas sp. C2]MEB3088876.1 rod shape-determining protein MreC [Parvimonas sp. M20]
MNRFRNIKARKKKISFFTTVIILSSIIFFSSNSSIMNIGENAIGTVTNSISRIVYSSIASSKEVFKSIFGSKAIREENEKLKIENAELKEKNVSMENIIAKEEFLKNEYNLYLKNKENLLSANVIALDNNSLLIRFNINKGSKDGVKVGDIIVQGTVGENENTYIKAVVGKVIEVGYNWSKVSSLVDSSSNVSFNVVRTQSYGAINGQENNLLSGFMYKSDADVVAGDKLVTSGRGGVFPRNLYIGEVTDVNTSENGLEKKISVKSPVDFTTLFRVFVLKGNGDGNE